MNQENKKLVLGFGNKARQGKDEAAKTILRERGSKYKIALISFADALRKEVDDTCKHLMSTGMAFTYQDALAIMCVGWSAEFDENAPVDDVYIHGKQRALLQAIGQGRRDEDPDYWLNLWTKQVEEVDADVVIVADVRYPNELRKIKLLGGAVVKFTREGYVGLDPEAAAHISETALDGAAFDHEIVVPDGNIEMLHAKAVHIFDYIMHQRQFGW